MASLYASGVDDFVIADVFFDICDKDDDVFFSFIKHAWDGEILRLVIDPSHGS